MLYGIKEDMSIDIIAIMLENRAQAALSQYTVAHRFNIDVWPKC